MEKYLNKQLKEISRLLQKPLHLYSLSTYHDLRTSCKKCRSVCTLLESSFKEFNTTRVFKSLDPIFSAAGEIREVQLEEVRLRIYFKNKRLPKYQHQLNKRKENAVKRFKKIIEDLDLKFLKEAKKYLYSYSHKITAHDIKQFSAKCENGIEKIISEDFTENKNIHELRKSFKHLLYLEKSTAIKSNSFSGRIKAISELLGKWHDCRVIIKQLGKINLGKFKSTEKLLVEKLKLRLFSQETILLSKSAAKLSNYYA